MIQSQTSSHLPEASVFVLAAEMADERPDFFFDDTVIAHLPILHRNDRVQLIVERPQENALPFRRQVDAAILTGLKMLRRYDPLVKEGASKQGD